LLKLDFFNQNKINYFIFIQFNFLFVLKFD